MNFKEIQRRRTFELSHPDAGKTTLTENYSFLVEPFRSRCCEKIIK
jgi:peptide subunit release factor RF-3